MIAEQMVIAEVAPVMTYKQTKKAVVALLRRYKKLPALIRMAERRARGEMLYLPTIAEKELDRLATVGRAYTTGHNDYIHQQKAEAIFHKVRGDDPVDEDAIDEIRGYMIGTVPFGYDGVLDEDGKVKPLAQKMIERAEKELAELRAEQRTVEAALSELASYRPYLEQILRLRYVEDMELEKVARAIDYSPRTLDDLKREAISEFAMLVGITEG